MNRAFFTVCTILCLMTARAQPWESYQFTEKGDTINRIDHRKLRQGNWLIVVPALRGESGYEEEGSFLNDLKEGAWRRFNDQGDLLAVENYKRGLRHGIQYYFNMFGQPLREESWISVDPENPYDTIDVPDLYNPMVTHSKVIRFETSEVRHGAWKFFDPETGRIIKTENYIAGQKEGGYARNGSVPPQKQDTSSQKKPVKPAAVLDWEKNNSGKKKVNVRDGRTGG